jgi:hypothetical protein
VPARDAHAGSRAGLPATINRLARSSTQPRSSAGGALAAVTSAARQASDPDGDARLGATKTGDPVSRVIRDLMLPRILAHGSTP